ncbi:hypothetical protein SAMN05421542_3010 [Chryseobacterium jejuense]|uniref:Uncharacterized protein n=1 Tax=Chryseobacterium jejuense TaxID=445960 RepID=A0A2X2VNQ6_CHRJE|nr:hypothetical protein SAMN05421542_3010 [Chryseobacterium jejuense]SQB28497.1 Uncharacterised protein [Chryseobacterium jejuense]
MLNQKIHDQSCENIPASYLEELLGVVRKYLEAKVILGSDNVFFVGCCFYLNHIFYENSFLYIG